MQYLTVPTYTPTATPVVPAPERSSADRARDARLSPELVAPVTVITPVGDLELGSGSLLIGRLPECDVLLQDNLVSRMHARLSVQGESVVVEDLHSTNGVYVNGLRVGHSTVLREGDRILIGTTEFSLFETRDSSLQRLRVARVQPELSEERLTPPAPVARPPSPPMRVPVRAENIPSTARADALKMIGGLADRLAATGNLEEAAQVLSGHLRRILKGANTGLLVPPDVAASASHHALTLARWTKQPLWVDYVVELHLSARLVMNAVTLASFEDVASRLDFDRMLLGYYVDGLKSRLDQLEPDERRRVERLRFLAEER
ncbi:MAG: FHA domain-containing protein [Myxococcales bacterium]|nr:MAG: FHA domain-containing protein [Myxococcales bacterium]